MEGRQRDEVKGEGRREGSGGEVKGEEEGKREDDEFEGKQVEANKNRSLENERKACRRE